MTNEQRPAQSNAPKVGENQVPLQPAKPAPGAEQKHADIDKALKDVDHKDRGNRTY